MKVNENIVILLVLTRDQIIYVNSRLPRNCAYMRNPNDREISIGDYYAL